LADLGTLRAGGLLAKDPQRRQRKDTGKRNGQLAGDVAEPLCAKTGPCCLSRSADQAGESGTNLDLGLRSRSLQICVSKKLALTATNCSVCRTEAKSEQQTCRRVRGNASPSRKFMIRAVREWVALRVVGESFLALREFETSLREGCKASLHNHQ